MCVKRARKLTRNAGASGRYLSTACVGGVCGTMLRDFFFQSCEDEEVFLCTLSWNFSVLYSNFLVLFYKSTQGNSRYVMNEIMIIAIGNKFKSKYIIFLFFENFSCCILFLLTSKKTTTLSHLQTLVRTSLTHWMPFPRFSAGHTISQLLSPREHLSYKKRERVYDEISQRRERRRKRSR